MLKLLEIAFKVSFSSTQVCNGGISDEIWQKTHIQIQRDATCSQDNASSPAVLGPSVSIFETKPTSSIPPSGTKKPVRKLFPDLFHKSSSQIARPPVAPPAVNGSSTLATEIQSFCQFLQELKTNANHLGSLLVPGDQKHILITSDSKLQAESAKILPLKYLLSPNRPPKYPGLLRRRRFETAAAAAWATLLLCGTPWLADTWNEDGLYFFLKNDDPNKESLARHPCISRLRRPPNGATVNSGYANVFGSKFIRNKAIFALGIVFIELCLNRTFDELRKQHSVKVLASTAMDVFEVATSLVDEVFLDAGDPYGNACQRCIRCEFPGRDVSKTFEFAQFRKDFYNGVVAPVQATFATIPP